MSTNTADVAVSSVSSDVSPRGPIARLSLRIGGSNPARAKEIERFLKFAVVGTIGAVIDLGASNLLLATVLKPKSPSDTVPVAIAASISFILAVCSNFIFNRYWTYPDSRSRPLLWQLLQFFVVNVVGFGIRLVTVKILPPPIGGVIEGVFPNFGSATVTVLAANGAIVVALVIVMLWNFFVNRYWTYNDVK